MAFSALVLAAAFSPTGLIIWLIIGLIAGFLASRIMGAGGYGVVGDVIVGLIGAFLGGLIANLLTAEYLAETPLTLLLFHPCQGALCQTLSGA